MTNTTMYRAYLGHNPGSAEAENPADAADLLMNNTPLAHLRSHSPNFIYVHELVETQDMFGTNYLSPGKIVRTYSIRVGLSLEPV